MLEVFLAVVITAAFGTYVFFGPVGTGNRRINSGSGRRIVYRNEKVKPPKDENNEPGQTN